MITTVLLRPLRRLAFAALAAASLAHGQGSLTPPTGAPAPGMKSLQEIWDELSAVKAENHALATQLNQLQTSITAQLWQTQLALGTIIPASALSWSITDLNTSGAFTSMAFGPDGHPAIAYKDSNNQLRFSRFDGSTWSSTTVDPDGGNGYQPASFLSLAFGTDGQPAIAYHYMNTGDLRFARFNGASWTVTTVDSDGETGWFASLAFGPDGHPAISYHSWSNADLRFARFDGSTWTLTTVDSTGETGQYTSLAFGPDGHPAISYHDATNRYLRFARFNGSSWTATTADIGGSFVGQITTGQYTSLAFGPDGQPAISYHDVSSADLNFTRFNGSSWTRTVVDSAGQVGKFTSLAFGPDGRAAISYSGNNGADLRFARFNGSTWTLATIDAGNESSSSSLSFGLDGQPAIAYHFGSFAGSLRFARLGLFKPAP